MMQPTGVVFVRSKALARIPYSRVQQLNQSRLAGLTPTEVLSDGRIVSPGSASFLFENEI